MSPFFCDNDYVFIMPRVFTRYRINDVIVVDHPHYGRIIKRICEMDFFKVKLCGDNLKSTNVGWVDRTVILGKVRFHIKDHGKHS